MDCANIFCIVTYFMLEQKHFFFSNFMLVDTYSSLCHICFYFVSDKFKQIQTQSLKFSISFFIFLKCKQTLRYVRTANCTSDHDLKETLTEYNSTKTLYVSKRTDLFSLSKKEKSFYAFTISISSLFY